MLNLLQHLETLKRVQGDGVRVLAMRVCVAFGSHAELASASGETLKRVQGDKARALGVRASRSTSVMLNLLQHLERP